jgi:hypothetical protein
VALRRWQAAGAEVVAEAGGCVLWVREPGTYRLTADFLLPRASPSPGVERIVVPAPIATSSAMTVVLASGTGEFTVSPPAVVLEDKTAGAERRVRLLAPPARPLAPETPISSSWPSANPGGYRGSGMSMLLALKQEYTTMRNQVYSSVCGAKSAVAIFRSLNLDRIFFISAFARVTSFDMVSEVNDV